jgi:predicted nuclease of predicted toxin-antitoxin system
MRFLVDQNISQRVIARLNDVFPDLGHVRHLGLTDANDHSIFMYARHHNFDAIISLDEDFYNLLLEHGRPPKIIWLRLGNCSTSNLVEVIKLNKSNITDFMNQGNMDCLEIYR